MVTVLSPVPQLNLQSRPMCPPVGPIRGKTIGLRRDNFWVSWDFITDEWARMLEADGARTVIWRAPIGKGDKAMVEGGEEYNRFLASSEVLVNGLCNCGSCSLWAVNDGVGALERGIPTVTVVTEQFEPLVRILAGQRGHGELRIQRLPYPIEGRPEPEIRQIAREYYPEMLRSLGAVR